MGVWEIIFFSMYCFFFGVVSEERKCIIFVIGMGLWGENYIF